MPKFTADWLFKNETFSYFEGQDQDKLEKYKLFANKGALDGVSDGVIQFARMLNSAESTGDASALLEDPLFKRIMMHGDTLAAQAEQGEREYVRFRSRLLYTTWLNRILLSFVQLEEGGTRYPHMLEHAKAMLHVLRQLYSLRQAAAAPDETERALAKAVRHRLFQFPGRSTQKEQQADTSVCSSTSTESAITTAKK